ncbi:SDR family oxidoreductase [Tenacibaculum retecalamus]|uniref:SDR family oxidoreductase n=1 Tax=Tenacibaculum retecalamus TaxID=3018315 RepID=UPI0023D8EB7A|nr:SDR family oxidoreductase [Tenacibaculum retecalamus]WBX70109.1 SDR family oxidoreductase [Tenacibaculum retecalamus]
MKFINKTILITGASRGIGASTSLLAGKKGYNVCVNFLNNDHLANNIVNEIKSQGGKAIAYKANISIEKGVIQLFKKIDKDFGKIDALVNNVGVLDKQSKVENLELERLQKTFNYNVISYFLCCKEAIKRMSSKNGGAGGGIVNVSSIASKTGAPNEYVDYAASKAAIDALIIGLSKEVANEKIRVNAVRPGFIYTDIHIDGGEPNRVDRIKEEIPMKRGGKPIEVAQAILWLLSEKSSFSTGIFIDITGGV